MATVDIRPMPEWVRKTRLKPHHPPIFADGEPTREDRELALELWRALDPASKRWYVGQAREFAGLPLADSDIESMRE